MNRSSASGRNVLFTFTVEGKRYKYKTVANMHRGIARIKEQGKRVDANTIKIEVLE